MGRAAVSLSLYFLCEYLPGRIVALLFADECDPQTAPMSAVAESFRRYQDRLDLERDEKSSILR
jgi:hypothetical protein